MSLFKKIVSDAVGQGIGKGIQNAVGKAVESAVRPAADKLAGQAADHLNQTTQNLADSTAAAQAAAQNAAVSQAAAQQAAAANTASAVPGASAAPGSGMASLGAALSGWAANAQNMAAQAAQSLKECPNCGEYATADQKYCPKCGAKLPDQTLGAGYVCHNCGKQNVPGTTFCSECGTRLPAAAEAASAELAKWDTLLPQYPKWTMGGVSSLEQSGSLNGAPVVSLRVEGAGRMQLMQYVEQLKAEGFVPAYEDDSDIYYKVVGGVCRAFDKTDAISNGGLSLSFFVGDFDKRAAVKEKADAAAGIAKDTAKAAADAAKGLFKKFF